MRFVVLAVAVLITLFCLVSPVQAANPDQVQQLLQERTCVNCDLSAADLKQVDLRGVNLSRANLRNADLRGVNLMAVNLRNADLRGANLSGTKFLVVDLTGANLKGADVSGTSLERVMFCHTIVPEGKVSNRNC